MADGLHWRYVTYCAMVVTWICAVDVEAVSSLGDLKEYCDDEGFDVQCGQNEVIVMTSALYGRMREGRCIVRSVVQRDCYIDVMSYMHQACSGRQQCSFLIGKIGFDLTDSSPSCFKSYVRYLEASYTCERVLVPDPDECIQRSVLSAPANHGAISSATSLSSGANDCPWSVRLPRGQRIKVKLYDYSSPTPNQDGSCDVIAVVREPDYKISETLCSGLEPGSVVYTSVGNSMEIRLLSKSHGESPPAFIIKYQALGCPDLDPPSSGWLEREGNSIKWGCDEEKTIGRLHCKDNKWNGSLRNCTAAPVQKKEMTQEKDLFQTVMDSPTVFPLVLAAALMLLIGIILCTTGLCFVIRYKCRQSNSDMTDPASFYYSVGSRSQKGTTSGEYLKPYPQCQGYNTTGRAFPPGGNHPTLSNTNTLPLRLPQNQKHPPPSSRNGLPTMDRASRDTFQYGTNRSETSNRGYHGNRLKEHVYDVPLMTSEEELGQGENMAGRPEGEVLLLQSHPHSHPTAINNTSNRHGDSSTTA